MYFYYTLQKTVFFLVNQKYKVDLAEDFEAGRFFGDVFALTINFASKNTGRQRQFNLMWKHLKRCLHKHV